MAGRLVVICGPMFAGKSSALIARVETSRAAGRSVVVVKPVWDDRYDAAKVVTHDGRAVAAMAVRSATELSGVIAELVVIDEAHFFGAALVEPVLAMIARGAEVVVAGVERNHRGEPFDPFPRLLIEADEVVKLHARCARCGGPAVHSQRMTASDAHIVVGGAEMYEARCRACFEPAR